MSTLHVLLPPLSRVDGDSEWRCWLARGDRLESIQPGYLPALAEYFQWSGGTLPAAALLRQRLAGDADGHVWLCADPASVQPDLTGARMLACGNLDLTPDEADALARPLRPLFGDNGMLLDLTTPSRWHLRLPQGAQPPSFATPEQVLGDDLIHHLPEGSDGRRWRTLFNETQMLLHQHPVNAERRRRGQMPVNGLWLWGGGGLPVWVRSSLGQVFSDDLLLQALAERAGIASQPLDRFEPDRGSAVETLVDLSEAGDAAARRQALQSALHAGADELALNFASGERYRMRRHHRWRFWRRGT